ncbi:putative 8-amino-7-oxononanoate synthase/2-amino-3-ketobutyrate coenzyme A ligase [Simkania negevensis Z]|uniref:Putative 8-amino-7-oxononanoate synthase/2-amino-3-ketobutyrate coenzyme A ligase n=2 Tax=Simkania negevensis TaxID=83561 RepID=F8L6H3_SIMNZ|nr:putative 8-amino-7-oxononanoate synthase/2-amino-3-ketobutyrate coenzyme A ligase [Simkania negevensis Z]
MAFLNKALEKLCKKLVIFSLKKLRFSVMKKYEYFHKALEKHREQKEYSQLRCVVPLDENHIVSSKQKMLNFASNDFLGLSQHPYVKKNTIKYVLEWGAGSSGSRLVTEHLEYHRNVEEKLADLLGKDSSLLFSSPFQAKQTLFGSIGGSRAIFFIDRFCENSLMQAASGSQSKLLRYEHQNLKQLRTLLEKHRDTSCTTKVIISESLFGLNGENGDLKGLIELAREHDALLCIDDSHAIGMMGKHGMGLASHRNGIDIVIGAFGKACGSFGAYIGLSRLMRDYMLAFSPQLVETTTLPPAVLGAISAALDLIPDMQVERQRVLEQSRQLMEKLSNLGWVVGESQSHLIPLLFSSESEVLKMAQVLSQKGILVTTLRPPAVPRGAARLRLTMNALHTDEHLTTLLDTLKSLKKEPSLSIV